MREKFWLFLSNHSPRELAYWCAVRVIVHATVGQYEKQVVPELLAMDALKRWERK